MSFETKRGYKVTLIGKEVIIDCKTFAEAKAVFDTVMLQILRGQLAQKWGKIRKRTYPA